MTARKRREEILQCLRALGGDASERSLAIAAGLSMTAVTQNLKVLQARWLAVCIEAEGAERYWGLLSTDSR